MMLLKHHAGGDTKQRCFEWSSFAKQGTPAFQRNADEHLFSKSDWLLGFFSSCFLAISLGKVIIFTKTVMLPAYLKDLPLLNSPLLNFPDFANIFLETWSVLGLFIRFSLEKMPVHRHCLILNVQLRDQQKANAGLMFGKANIRWAVEVIPMSPPGTWRDSWACRPAGCWDLLPPPICLRTPWRSALTRRAEPTAKATNWGHTPQFQGQSTRAWSYHKKSIFS